MLNQRIKFTFV